MKRPGLQRDAGGPQRDRLISVAPAADQARPLVGRARPASIFMVVVFPAPLGPTNPVTLRLYPAGEVIHGALVPVSLGQLLHGNHRCALDRFISILHFSLPNSIPANAITNNTIQ